MNQTRTPIPPPHKIKRILYEEVLLCTITDQYSPAYPVFPEEDRDPVEASLVSQEVAKVPAGASLAFPVSQAEDKVHQAHHHHLADKADKTNHQAHLRTSNHKKRQCKERKVDRVCMQ